MFKECNKCLNILHIDNFYVYNKGYLGRRSVCKKCKCEKDNIRRRTPKGMIHTIYNNQVKSSKRRGHHRPTYTKIELYNWVMSQSNFNKLYNDWVYSNYNVNLIPSVDSLGYSINNIQLITWLENNIKGRTAPKRHYK